MSTPIENRNFLAPVGFVFTIDRIKKVTYLARVWFDRDIEYKLREGLLKGDPSAKRLADVLWKKKKDIEDIVERKVNEYTKSKESYRQKNRNRWE